MSAKVVAVGAIAAVIVAGGAVWYVDGRSGDEVHAAAAPLSTATVEQHDVVTYQETSATLGFTQSVTVSSPVAGTVTSVVAAGDPLVAGSIVATVDGNPVVAMIGEVPGWRDLSTSSSDGVDVRQLETNLVALGFDPNGKIAVDESYDSATKAAVNLWKASLGLVEDGKVAQGLVTFVPGALQTDTVDTGTGLAVGQGGALVTARVTERQVPVIAQAGRTVSSFATAGTPITTGTTLFRVDGLPVVAIEGDPSALPMLGRDLSIGVAAGSDVLLLEQMLAAGGFTAGGTLVVDDTFDEATATAVLAWWQSIDPAISVDVADLVVPEGSFVIVPSGLEVGGPKVAEGTVLTADTSVLELTSPAREVTTSAPIGDATFVLGATIQVEFPDGTFSDGTVVNVGSVATNPSGTPGQTPSVDITIQVDDIPATVDSFVSIPVTLRVVDEEVDNAFVVPTSALVALAEGGYALEVVVTPASGTTPAVTKLIAVEPGLYSDGFVVVTGDGLEAGLTVVVPS